jgi:viroplasmin and RNaseH domain-containing protein
MGYPDAKFAGFWTIEKAREYMNRNEAYEFKEVIKDTALQTTPERESIVYYAVAYGANPGIHTVW